MTGSRKNLLYQLLPALYRELDEHQGQPLRALMAVLESEYARLEEDMGAVYDNWFIETCDRWVVPYIADLLHVGDLQDLTHIPSQRHLVANTIAYRRRKGTAAVLEHVVRDATGWYARCVEFARQLAITQHMAHTRLDSGRTVDIRQLPTAAQVNGPLDTQAHTVDLDNGDQSKYNSDSIGLLLWRLRSYPVTRSFAHRIRRDDRTGRRLPRGCYTFDPLGQDVPLFNKPQSVTRITHPAQPHNLPLRLSQADLVADLQGFRARYGGVRADWRPKNSRLYGPDRSLYIERKGKPIAPSAVVSMDLSEWPEEPLPDRAVVAVDVERGRFAFVDVAHLPHHLAAAVNSERIIPVDIRDGLGDIIVNYNYGFSTEIGGGPYSRQYSLDEPVPGTEHFYLAKGSEIDTLQEALRRWNEYCRACARNGRTAIGRITFLDNGLYGGWPLEIVLPRGAQLTIAAGDGVRPIIRPLTKLEVGFQFPPPTFKMAAVPELEEQVEPVPVIDRLLHLNGLVICGGMQIGLPSDVEGKVDLEIQHCTLMPDGLDVQSAAKEAAKLRVDIQHSIVGPLRLPAEVAAFAVRDSIIHHSGGYAIAAPAAIDQPNLPPDRIPGPAVTLKRTTVFGKVSVQELRLASEVIFIESVFVKDCKRGGVSFSYVPAGSQTPPREFCQPPDGAPAGKVRPRFTSVRFGDPAYAQLSLDCPREIRGGTADGSEMGAFHGLYQLEAEENARKVLEEYLPAGLRASIQYVT